LQSSQAILIFAPRSVGYEDLYRLMKHYKETPADGATRLGADRLTDHRESFNDRMFENRFIDNISYN